MQYSHPSRIFAILVDGDNAPPSALKAALDEVKKQGGSAKIRLVFGNGESLKGMKDAASASGFRPVLQFTLAQRKNATDIALAVAAIDLLHTGSVDAFCIVSSDSDFHPLVTRLREAGCYVIGMGNAETPGPLMAACDDFVPLSAPKAEPATPKMPVRSKTTAPMKTVESPRPTPAAPEKPPQKPLNDLPRLQALLRGAYAASKGEDEWVALSHLGAQVRVIEPAFSAKAHGRKQLGLLVVESGMFETRPGAGGGIRHVRLKT